MSWSVLEGDCLEHLRAMADESADSIVTDPPYDLTANKRGGSGLASMNLDSPYGRARIGTGNGSGGFMGQRWDGTGIAFDPATWREALRVLKPGGHLLAFGGTRTYHRMACAIEDAGFEIRDSLHWHYGTGFPKSLNVGKALDELEARCECHCDMRRVWDDVPDMEGVAQESEATDLLEEVQREGSGPGVRDARSQGSRSLDAGESAVVSGEDDGSPKPGVERRGDLPSEARSLRQNQVRSLPAGVPLDGEGRWVRDGAPAGDGQMDREAPGSDRGGAPREPQPDAERAEESRTLAGQPDAQTLGAWQRCDGCGRPMVPEGLGTALKPAHEPIVLARKPLTGTVAENVLAHGTGGLNIDGCRVATGDDLNGGASAGRWPPNLLLSHSPGCVASDCAPGCPVVELDRQSGDTGQRSDLVGDEPSSKTNGIFGKYAGRLPAPARGDTGGASRFFPTFSWDPILDVPFLYCAKPSRAERDAGLEDVAPTTGGEATERSDGSAGTQSPRSGAGRNGGSKNFHPTVKPLALMEWLCRLVTPPGGLVLDPFMGSGTTGSAAVRAGFNFIGIEREPPYVQIAERRIALAAGAPRAKEIGELIRLKPAKEAEPGAQLGLFGGPAT